VTALNAVPKVAIIPLVVIVFGASGLGDGLTACMVVFFMFFYNALTGGASVPKEVLQNMRVFGASSQSILWTIRLRYVAAWIFAQLPNGISLSLVGAVTSELLTGSNGLGFLLVTSVNTSDATLTFAVVVVLMVTGVVLVVGTDFVEHKFFPWIEAVRQR
jgi:NitT/TauT family transport system permease protein